MQVNITKCYHRAFISYVTHWTTQFRRWTFIRLYDYNVVKKKKKKQRGTKKKEEKQGNGDESRSFREGYEDR